MSWLLESGGRPAFLSNLSGIGEVIAVCALAFIHFGPLLVVMVTLAISFHEAFFARHRNCATYAAADFDFGEAEARPAIPLAGLVALKALTWGVLSWEDIGNRTGRAVDDETKRDMEQRGLIERTTNGRQEVLQLTPAGREALLRWRQERVSR